MSSIVEEVLPTIRTHFSKLRVPHGHDKVYNDECVVSFDSPFSDNGLYINLISFYGYGADYYLADSKKTNNQIYLHSKWKQVLKEKETSKEGEEVQQQPSKLAIGVEGGFSLEDHFDIIKTYSLVVIHNNTPITIPLPNADLPDMLIQVLDAVINHKGMRSSLEKSSWEADQEPLIISKYADSLIQLDPNGKTISNNPKDWRCERSGDTENLWLNLSTGYIGGGRKNWDGSGGSGAALEHFNETGGLYPLCVKLGTITPHTADVFSYAPDEDDLVKDPKLGEHLAHWGIDIMKLEKTDKSMGEMEVEMNQNYNWSKIVEADSELIPMSGAGFVGLRNIGSSCYINSVLQTFCCIPEFKERYMGIQAQLFESCEGDPSMDLGLQLSKVATALLTDRYVPKAGTEDEWVMVNAHDKNEKENTQDAEAAGKKDQLEKYVIAPRMFKNVAARNNRDYLSGQQQDAGDYFLHFLESIRQYEVANLNKVDSCNTLIPTNKLFEIIAEERTQCSVTNEVRYKSDSSLTELMLGLTIPLEAATNATEVSEAQEKKRQKLANEGPNSVCIEDNVVPKVPFNACLERYFGVEEVQMMSPSLGNQNVMMNRTKKLTNFPRYLMIRLLRYTMDSSWRTVKIDASIDVPEKLDLSAYKATGIQEGEVPMPDSIDDGNNSNIASTTTATTGPIEPDETVMAQLITMGFGENGCKRACIAGNNDVNAAMEWVFAHMGDADFNDPIVNTDITDNSNGNGGSSSSGPSAELIESLQAMGATTDQAKAALMATDNDLARAADWFFSRDNLDAEVAAVLNGAAGGSNTSTGTGGTTVETIDPNAQGLYSMVGIISHLGRSPDCGHYVCHVKKDGQWVLFNDEKVAQSKAPPLDQGFVYLFRRDDSPDTFTTTI